jgi:hypothetical protein
MALQIDFWQLVGVAIAIMTAVFGGVVGLARWLASEYDRRQEARFADFKQSCEVTDRRQSDTLARHMQENLADVVRIADHAERLARLEEAIRRVPSHDDIKGVHGRLDGIASKTDVMQGQLPGLIDSVRMILNILQKDRS